ncbi:MAG: hypothetical protein LBC98_08410 [Prevotellaceae bacterium]|nr:hypothetical protein [Prevotellaceae bacterium]
MKKTVFKFLFIMFAALLGLRFEARAQFFYDEPGRGATGIFQLLGSNARYTASPPNPVDNVGQGWIRLTPAQANQRGYVVMDRTFPTTLGVTVEFDFKVWGTNMTLNTEQADGFCVFLIDATAAAGAFNQGGAVGGGLAFIGAGNTGATPTYMGVGIDEYGNFANNTTTGANGGPFSGAAPHSIVLRTGSIQPGTNRYRYLKGTSGGMEVTYTPQAPAYNTYTSSPLFAGKKYISSTITDSRPTDAQFYRRARINFDPLPSGGVRVSVKIKFDADPDFTEIFTYDYASGTNAFMARPDTMRVGFSATTGAVASYHEVRNVIVRTPGVVQVIKQPVDCPQLNTPTRLQTTLTCFSSQRTITVSDTLPQGFTVSNVSITSDASYGFVSTPQVSSSGGRQIYTYSIAMNGNAHAYVNYDGQFTQSGPVSTAAKITSINPNSGLSANDLITYSRQEGAINDLAAISPSTGTMMYLVNNPITFNVSATTPVNWVYSSDGGHTWTNPGATGNSYTPPASLFSGAPLMVRCVAGAGSCFTSLNYSCVAAPDNIVAASCYVTPPATAWSIRELTPIYTAHTVDNYSCITVGDIDGDGTVEMLAYTDGTGVTASPSAYYAAEGLRMFYIDQGRVKHKRSFNFVYQGTQLYVGTIGAMAICRHLGQSYIIVTASDNYVYAFDHNGTCRWKSNATYSPATGNSYMASLADFNHDGVPEIVLGNKIFSLTTGNLLADGGANNTGNNGYVAIGDMDLDGDLDIIAGTQIYRVVLASSTTANAGNSITVMTGGYQYSAGPPDGLTAANSRTQVADIDLDGQLEVIVNATNGLGSNDANARVGTYVWKPNPGGAATLVGKHFTNTRADGISLPMIGNIDASRYPEICFISGSMNTSISPNNRYIWALYYDESAPAGDRIRAKIPLAHTDQSVSTGMTLFDFNLDGRNEIVYRDTEELRILSGEGSAVVGLSGATFTNVKSGTLWEYPVIADVDNDGEAEIIITGHDSNASERGYIRVFKSGAGKWAASRKVWNQYGYRSLNVNDNLSVPAYQLDPSTRFAGSDGIMNNGDDVFPFNNVMQQQTLLSINGIPLWLTPDFTITGAPHTQYYADGDSLMVRNLCVYNYGDARSADNIWIAVYRNSRAPANLIQTYNFPAGMAFGEHRCYDLKINAASQINATDLHIEVNNDGTKYPQLECDTIFSNDNIIPFSTIPMARSDRMTLFACEAKFQDILANDGNVAGGTLSIVKNGSRGSASSPSNMFIYDNYITTNCYAHGGKRDTVRYNICHGSNCSEANIFIDILRRPEILLRDSCSRKPFLTIDFQYKNAQYEWFRSTDKISWTPIGGSPQLKMYVTDQAWYKAVVNYNGDTVETQPVFFRILRKSQLAGNLFWYESELNRVN